MTTANAENEGRKIVFNGVSLLPLDYADGDNSVVRSRPTLWGVLSFVAVVLFVPWSIAWFYIAWAHDGMFDALTRHWARFAFWAPIAFPLFIAFALGLCSIMIDGLRLKNILGVIGLCSSAVILVMGGLAAYFTNR